MDVEKLMTQGLHLTLFTLPYHRSDEEMDEAEGAIVVAKGTSSGRSKKVDCAKSQLSDVLGGGLKYMEFIMNLCVVLAQGPF